MPRKISLSSFIEQASNIPASLIRSTVKQAGGWQSFVEDAPNVCQGGANAGFSGFINYGETVAFTKRNKAAILQYADAMASDIGETSAANMIAGFRCIDLSSTEVAEALYNRKSTNQTEVFNALAWFALEEVASAYCDLTE
jgi:hypothetical protein